MLIGREWRERGGSPRAAEKVAVEARHGDAGVNKSSVRRDRRVSKKSSLLYLFSFGGRTNEDDS